MFCRNCSRSLWDQDDEESNPCEIMIYYFCILYTFITLHHVSNNVIYDILRPVSLDVWTVHSFQLVLYLRGNFTVRLNMGKKSLHCHAAVFCLIYLLINSSGLECVQQ